MVRITSARNSSAVASSLRKLAGRSVFVASLRDAVEQKCPPIGPEGFSRIAQALRRRAPDLPIVGIAAIDAGADGVAVISALSLADDPAARWRAHCARLSTACWQSAGRSTNAASWPGLPGHPRFRNHSLPFCVGVEEALRGGGPMVLKRAFCSSLSEA